MVLRCMGLRGLSFLPIFLIVWTSLTFILCYIISVVRGDVDPGFPYISDTGAKTPESSLFGQMLNISAVAAFMVMFVRYKQVKALLVKLPDEKVGRVQCLNTFELVLAVLISFGLSLVANFQEISVADVHFTGAALAFGLGTLFEFCDSYISYKMYPEVNGKLICHIRLALSVLSLCLLLTCVISMEFASVPFKFHWTQYDKGLAEHLTSTISEWCLAITFFAYFCTYVREFAFITITIQLILHSELPNERTPLLP